MRRKHCLQLLAAAAVIYYTFFLDDATPVAPSEAELTAAVERGGGAEADDAARLRKRQRAEENVRPSPLIAASALPERVGTPRDYPFI